MAKSEFYVDVFLEKGAAARAEQAIQNIEMLCLTGAVSLRTAQDCVDIVVDDLRDHIHVGKPE